MRKSLFSKIFLTQMISILTVIVVIVPMIFISIGEYFVSVQKDGIIKDAKRVAEFAGLMVRTGAKEEIWNYFRDGIEFIAGFTVSKAFLKRKSYYGYEKNGETDPSRKLYSIRSGDYRIFSRHRGDNRDRRAPYDRRKGGRGLSFLR